jgi:hypothetical protein
MCCRPETIKAQVTCAFGHLQRPKADQPGTQQRCRLNVREHLGNRETETPVGNGVLGVTTVQMTTGELRLITQILPARAAELALAAGPAKPGNAHPLADPVGCNFGAHCGDFTDDFMSRHPRQYRLW